MAWIWLVLLYGILKGTRDIAKKKAMERNAALEVLFLYTALSFVMVLPDAGNAMGLTAAQLGWTAVKSFVIFVGWMGGFYALSHMPVSLYGVLDLSQMIFSILLGVIWLGEPLLPMQAVGLVLVTGGLLMLKRGRGESSLLRSEAVPARAILMALMCCFFNAISGTLDKILMRSMTSSQLQFWYMLFLSAWYGVYLLVRRIPFDWRSAVKNYWIWIMAALLIAALLIAGDRALFLANGMESSSVIVMTLIKQIACVMTIIGGRLVFKEKNTGYKLVCAGVVIAGIVVSVIR